MSKHPVKNIAASVHDRLLRQAKKDRRPFDELLQYFAMERLLYRWSKSRHVKGFVLKGAVMLRVWEAGELRPTRDIDMLSKNTVNNPEAIVDIVKEVIALEVESDGLMFLQDTVTAERITEDADYEGVRIKFIGRLGNAKINMQIDIGFGDIVYPDPVRTQLPSMLNFPHAFLLCYSRESAIAEKLQAMIHLGDANSRMKDFFDIYALSRQFNFRGAELAEAIRLTFVRRKTEIPKEVSSFKKEFIERKDAQWKAFKNKIEHNNLPESFEKVISDVRRFILPILKAIVTGETLPTIWNAPGPWVVNKQKQN